MGTLTIPSSGTIYVDTNCIIYGVEKVPPYDSLLLPLWQKALGNQIAIVTSELTWLETLARPFATGNTQLEGLFRAFLTNGGVGMIAPTLQIWERAAHLRGQGLKTPDALHAATALDARCDLFHQ